MKSSANWPLGSEDISGKVESFFQKASSAAVWEWQSRRLFPMVTFASVPQALLLTEDAEDPFLSLNTHSPSLVGGQACSDHDCQLYGLSCNQRLSRIPQTTTVSLAFGHHQLREGTTMMSPFLQAFVESWIPGSIKRNLQILGDCYMNNFLFIS